MIGIADSKDQFDLFMDSLRYLGMIPLVSDKFFQALPAALAPLLDSGILLATVSAVLTNILFNRSSPE